MLKMTMSCGPYDRARALIDKTVTPEGIDLDIFVNYKNPGHITEGENRPFDAVEFYTGRYMSDLPHRTLGYTAIPIFVKRMFRHSYIYINNKSGIRSPRDLNGARIGLQNWFTSAGIWGRALLEDEFGLDVKSVRWVARHKDGHGVWTPPSWLNLEVAPKETKHFDLLASGDIQALITTDVCAPGLHPNIDFLFPNYAELERDYFKRTGYFPIMHTLLIRTELLDREPWVAMSMYTAWMASKQACYKHLEWQRVHMTALWYRALHEEQTAVAGEDFYRWGFRQTRAEVDKMLEYVYRYGIVSKKFEPEEMFHPSTLDT
jgi:4,5-dihydroxyphthalate decarboxylase